VRRAVRRSQWCAVCLADDTAVVRATAKRVVVPRAAESVHRAEFEGGCKVTLRISAGGVASHWDPHPRVLSFALQQRVAGQFASWRNRLVKQFAAERGLAVRPASGSPDLLEPCEAHR